MLLDALWLYHILYNIINIKDFLHQTLAGYVVYSTENKFGPLTIKHLPTPMIVDTASYSITQSFGHVKSY